MKTYTTNYLGDLHWDYQPLSTWSSTGLTQTPWISTATCSGFIGEGILVLVYLTRFSYLYLESKPYCTRLVMIRVAAVHNITMGRFQEYHCHSQPAYLSFLTIQIPKLTWSTCWAVIYLSQLAQVELSVLWSYGIPDSPSRS